MDWMNGWVVAGGAAACTFLATGFSYLRNLYQQVVGRVVVTMTVSGYQADAILIYLRQHFAASRFGPRAYLGWKLFYRPQRRVQLMPMEVTAPSGRLYWRGCRPIWVAKSKEQLGQLESGVTSEDYSFQTLAITFLRGTLDCDRLIIDATRYYNDQVRTYDATDGRRHSIRYVHGSAGMTASELTLSSSSGPSCPTSSSDIRGCLVNRPLGFAFSELGMEIDPERRAVDRLALGAQARQLVQEVQRWHETEQWHYDRALPWRRGFLLYGKPGTGKTALARAVAEDLDIPIYVFDLASLKNSELQQAWTSMLEEVPCMALIEDIDAVFHGRQNVAVASGPSLTFDCLLNCLDGVQRADGLLVMMTTNHLEKVDPAIGQPGEMGSRPGRIDRVIELDDLDQSGRRKIAARILSDWPESIEMVCESGYHDTPAQFQERCSRLALRLLYGEEPVLEYLEC